LKIGWMLATETRFSRILKRSPVARGGEGHCPALWMMGCRAGQRVTRRVVEADDALPAFCASHLHAIAVLVEGALEVAHSNLDG
jgi:hypothetical protein